MAKKFYLDQIIDAKQLTRRVVAEKIGTTNQLVGRWATGELTPNLMYILRLKKVLGRHLKVEELLSKKHVKRQAKWEKEL